MAERASAYDWHAPVRNYLRHRAVVCRKPVRRIETVVNLFLRIRLVAVRDLLRHGKVLGRRLHLIGHGKCPRKVNRTALRWRNRRKLRQRSKSCQQRKQRGKNVTFHKSLSGATLAIFERFTAIGPE